MRGSRIRTSSPTEERRCSTSSGPPNPPPLPSPLASSKPPSSNPSSGSFPKKAYCPASKLSATRSVSVRSSQNRKVPTFSTQITSDNHELNATTARETISRKQIDIFLKLLTGIILHQSTKIRIRNAATEAPTRAPTKIGPNSTNNQPTNNNNRTNRRPDQTRRETQQRSQFSGKKPHLQRRRTCRRRGRGRRARRPASWYS